MTSRVASLEASGSINSSDLAAGSNSPKKPGQGEIKFQQVLASTRGKSHKESGNSSEDSNSKTSKDSKFATSNLKPQAARTKTGISIAATANIDKAGKVDDYKAELENLEVSEEIELEVIERIDNASELVPAISTSQTKAAEVILDLDISVPKDIKPVSDDENIDTNEVKATKARETVAADIDIAKGASEASAINNETTNENLRGLKVSTLQVQTTLTTSRESKERDLPIEDSSETNEQAKSLSAVKEVAEETSVDGKNTVNISVPADISNLQKLEQEEIKASRNQTNLQTNFTRPEALKNISTKPEPDAIFTNDASKEEDVVAFGNAQNIHDASRMPKSSAASSLTQNIFNQTKDSLPQEFGAFDEDGSNEFDNLFSKMDSFVTMNDGKLSIDFKEIANLPEENIPHRADQISMAVKSAVGRGQSEISLRMYPEDLGAVDVKIEFSEVGKVQSIKFFAAKESTLELLQKDYSILERSLKEVINAEDASLSFNLKDGKGEGSEYQPRENFGLNDISEGSSGSERIITANYQATLQIQKDDQVDITV
jgi:hypothetical protein